MAISAAAGATGVGLVSKVRQVKALVNLGKTAVAAAEVLTDAAVAGGESAVKQLADKGSVSVKETVKDAGLGAVASVAGQVAKNAKRATEDNELKTLKNSLTMLKEWPEIIPEHQDKQRWMKPEVKWRIMEIPKKTLLPLLRNMLYR